MDYSCRIQVFFFWGDETSSRVISLIPKKRFQKIAFGGYDVCRFLEGVSSRAYCRGTSLGAEEAYCRPISPTYVDLLQVIRCLLLWGESFMLAESRGTAVKLFVGGVAW